MSMTHRQRILAAARRQPVDKIPFGARIDLWYNYHAGHGTLPKKYQGWNMVDILRDQGTGVQLRHGETWKREYSNVEIEVKKEPPRTTTIWRTPKGDVSMETIFTPEEGPVNPYEVDHPFKGPDDYPIIEYILENTTLIPDLTAYYEKEKLIGEDGVVRTGSGYSPMQRVMRYWIGFERFFYELHDNRARVEHLFELEKELAKQRIRILSDLPVEIPGICGNWDDSFHTPIFAKYFLPWLKETSDYFHSIGKLTQVHVDGEMKRLIPFFPETGIDVAEAWSPAPMTSVTTAELRKAWGDAVTIWGGIPSMLFGPQYSDEEFDDYVKDLLREVAPGNNFIVGLGDNLPFDGKIERIGRVVDLIEKQAATSS